MSTYDSSEQDMQIHHNSLTKPFIEHLEDLRSTILLCVMSVVITTLICFAFSPGLFSFLIHPLSLMDTDTHMPALRSLQPVGAFMMSMKTAFAGGVIASLPLNLFLIGKFILPALTNKEKTMLIPVFSAGAVLFAAGIVFCYFMVIPISLRFLWNFASWIGVVNDWTLEYYIEFVTRFLLVFGCMFELPLVVISLVFLNILSYSFLARNRRYVIVIIFIFAALVTPPDVLSQVLLALPLLGLYEISVWCSLLIEKKRLASKHLAG
ncbi:MAG: twin-arginine translocase subunit TatC [Candidatus Auribacter fodinae]|uniref:Sec-independent protein translocase protein TatC n=1 Tax=Candidatus Auribacter fodinae TaxID=2093366 RepID=A0A3A4R5I6_9BACT|nr:MAG: twin-arginine translocase subunit TatC [Candidatus Auribacter fodinae]